MVRVAKGQRGASAVEFAIIAPLFIAALIAVVEFGMIACVLVLPLALICGPLRGIPLFWRLIDCSFGIVGIVPLWFARGATLEMRTLAELSTV